MKDFDYEVFGEFEVEQSSVVANASKYTKEEVAKLFIKESDSIDLDEKYDSENLSEKGLTLEDCVDVSKVKEVYIREATQDELDTYGVDDYWFIGEKTDDNSIRCWEFDKEDLIDPDVFL